MKISPDLALVLASLLFGLGVSEITLRAARHFDLISYSLPVPEQFWDGTHPIFGVWHQPNASYRHRSPGNFDVIYKTNSVGARDKERSKHSPAKRIFVLGDSMIEGWGLEDEQRLSNRLEAMTHFEHMNFGMSHFGNYQEALVYQHYGKEFQHDAILMGIYPGNDFMDNSLKESSEFSGYEYRYRPYLEYTNGQWSHKEYRENPFIRFFRRYSHLYSFLKPLLYSLKPFLYFGSKTMPSRGVARHGPSSAFYEFKESNIIQLVEILKFLRDEAHEKQIIVVLIPDEEDLRQRKISGPDKLGSRLQTALTPLNIELVNLLPVFYGLDMDPAALFHKKDFHWNALANQIAADHLYSRLAHTIYSTAETLPAEKSNSVQRKN